MKGLNVENLWSLETKVALRSLFLFRQLNITLHGSSSTKHVHIMDAHAVDSNLLFSN